jgi:hypothetical protein
LQARIKVQSKQIQMLKSTPGFSLLPSIHLLFHLQFH